MELRRGAASLPHYTYKKPRRKVQEYPPYYYYLIDSFFFLHWSYGGNQGLSGETSSSLYQLNDTGLLETHVTS